MNFKSILFLLFTALWFALCWRYYTCNIKKKCVFEHDSAVETILKEEPIQFLKDSDSAYLSNFEAYRDSITLMANGKNVDIIGQYYLSEKNTTSFENLGLARAHKLKQLLAQSIDTSKIFISSKLKELDTVEKQLFVATMVSVSDSVNLNSDKAQIVSRNGILEVYFPIKSNKNIVDAVFDSILNVYMKTAINENKKVSISGHTDNTGLESENINLSKERAETIKSKLISLGVKDTNITTEGKGSVMPKTNNATSENRALNRRVEIKF